MLANIAAKIFWGFVRSGFYLSLAAFLVVGTALVLSQAGGVVSMSSTFVALSGRELGPVAFASATVCGLFAFASTYRKEPRDRAQDDGEGTAFEVREGPDASDARADARTDGRPSRQGRLPRG